jgi:hypothetical protein
MKDHARLRRPSLCLAILAGLALLPTSSKAQNPAVTIPIDVNANRKPINPLIYGVAHATGAQVSDLNVPLNRHGGNNTSRYNWQQNADNRGQDWYFESIGDSSATPGERGDTFISATKGAGGQPAFTIPMIGWVAKLGANRSKLASFSIAKYGAQTGNDWQWFPDAGNGIRTSGGYVTGNDKNDANVQVDSLFMQGWVDHVLGVFGPAASGGLKYYILDNEPSLWHSTHRDVFPTGATMDDIRNRILDYAAKVKDRDPGALIVAPEEWGWSGYLYSGYDQQWGSNNGWSNLPDRAAHGGWDYLPWLLDQLRQKNTATGRRLLDVFTVHYYPQGGEFSDDTSSSMQLRRNRSTRSLWDPNYVDESWIGTQVKLIPRIKGWVQTYYPGTQTGITEYNWGAESHINGATAQADIFGIFGREGLDMGARWTTPGASTPTYKAIKMYRNYDGAKSTFGDTSVSCAAPSPDNVAAFAAERSSDGALTVMVISKYLSGSTSVTLNLANFAGTGTGQAWQLTSSNSINRLADVTYTGSSLTATVPAQSITLFVLPKSSGGTSPVFTVATTATPSQVAPGGSSTISTTVTCATDSLSNGVVDIEVCDAAGTRVAQQYWTGQSFTTGQQQTYNYVWTAPATAGLYTVRVGVFGANWTPNYYWNANAATINVSAPTTAQYTFETSTQGWATTGGIINSVARSSVQKFEGAHSLLANFNGKKAGTARVYVRTPAAPAGSTVTFHVWIPAGSKVASVQPYVQQGASGNWTWTGNWQPIGSLTAGAWNTIQVTVPSNAVTPLYEMGIEFVTSAGWKGACYVDSIGW